MPDVIEDDPETAIMPIGPVLIVNGVQLLVRPARSVAVMVIEPARVIFR